MNGYRFLLRLAPRRLRDKHGAEMEAMFREHLADARRRGAIAEAAVWCRAAGDIVPAFPSSLFSSGGSVDMSACRVKGDRS